MYNLDLILQPGVRAKLHRQHYDEDPRQEQLPGQDVRPQLRYGDGRCALQQPHPHQHRVLPQVLQDLGQGSHGN